MAQPNVVQPHGAWGSGTVMNIVWRLVLRWSTLECTKSIQCAQDNHPGPHLIRCSDSVLRSQGGIPSWNTRMEIFLESLSTVDPGASNKRVFVLELCTRCTSQAPSHPM